MGLFQLEIQMPGPKYPKGYHSYYHDIAAKLVAERPERLEVDMPVPAIYGRNTFNYFRQSWLRWYEFCDKKKDHQQATAALTMYNSLIGYQVQIAQPNTLIFTSKQMPTRLVMRSTGTVQPDFSDWIPQKGEEHKDNIRPGLIKLSSNEGIPSWDGKKQDAEIAATLGIKPVEKPAPIISNNPRPERAPATPEEHAFFMVYLRLPKSQDELDRFEKGEAIN